MSAERLARIAVVDYGLGNLFSVKHACEHEGMEAFVTSSKADILGADGVILPGVGAFGDAMTALQRLDLVGPLREVAAGTRPLVGICLGIQLLMDESFEFGCHEGLGIIPGSVVRLDPLCEGDRELKVPQVGWNGVHPTRSWEGTLLEGLGDGEPMYFVHSFVVQPRTQNVVLSTTRYGQQEFCSSLALGSVFACQFHPERSGRQGLKVYANLKKVAEFIRKE